MSFKTASHAQLVFVCDIGIPFIMAKADHSLFDKGLE